MWQIRWRFAPRGETRTSLVFQHMVLTLAHAGCQGDRGAPARSIVPSRERPVPRSYRPADALRSSPRSGCLPQSRLTINGTLHRMALLGMGVSRQSVRSGACGGASERWLWPAREPGPLARPSPQLGRGLVGRARRGDARAEGVRLVQSPTARPWRRCFRSSTNLTVIKRAGRR